LRWPLFIFVVIAFGLSACSISPKTTPSTDTPGSDRYEQEVDSGPPSTEDVNIEEIPLPEPIEEEPSRYGNHSPYVVSGKTYHVLPSAEGYVAEGIASWYGSKFHGHRTSSGEIYDMYQFTAAHRSLPLPTFARVTNLDNQKSVIVRINDRGPFHDDREIDLSWAAAKFLGIDEAGTGRVRVETISGNKGTLANPTNKNTTAVGIHAAADSPPPPAELYLQVGAFREAQSAQTLQSKLLQSLSHPVSIRPYDKQGERVYRLWVGPFTSENSRTQTKEELINMGYTNTVNASP